MDSQPLFHGSNRLVHPITRKIRLWWCDIFVSKGVQKCRRITI